VADLPTNFAVGYRYSLRHMLPVLLPKRGLSSIVLTLSADRSVGQSFREKRQKELRVISKDFIVYICSAEQAPDEARRQPRRL